MRDTSFTLNNWIFPITALIHHQLHCFQQQQHQAELVAWHNDCSWRTAVSLRWNKWNRKILVQALLNGAQSSRKEKKNTIQVALDKGRLKRAQCWLKNRCTDLPVSEHQSNKRVGSNWKKCCLINIQSMCSSDAAHFIGVTIVLWSCCCKTSLATANCFTVNVRETWVGPIITNAWKPDFKKLTKVDVAVEI